MTTDAPPAMPPPPSEPASTAPISEPLRGRDRLRLLALFGLIALWVGPAWVNAQIGDDTVPETGAVRTGILGALALLALWGLSATSLAARTVRGLRAGAALTDAALALTTTLLLLAGHPWIPGGAMREAWVPIFLPLTLLALLDAGVVLTRGVQAGGAGGAIAVIRSVAALFAAGALAVNGDYIPAAIALWLGLTPLIFARPLAPKTARRLIEWLLLQAGVLAGLSPWIQRTVIGWNPAVGGKELSIWVYLWCVTAALVVTTAIDGLMRPEAET